MSTLNHSDVYAVTTTSTHKPSAPPTYAIINLDSRSCIPAEYLHWWQDAYRAATAVGRKEDPDFYTERAVMAARWDVVFYMLHKHSKLYKALYRLAMYDPRLLITLLSEDKRIDAICMRIAMDSKNIFACACILTNWTDSASIASFTTLCLRQYKLSVSSTNYTNYINVILDAYRDYIDSNVTTRAYLFVFGVVFGKFKCSEESIIINTVKTMF